MNKNEKKQKEISKNKTVKRGNAEKIANINEIKINSLFNKEENSNKGISFVNCHLGLQAFRARVTSPLPKDSPRSQVSELLGPLGYCLCSGNKKMKISSSDNNRRKQQRKYDNQMKNKKINNIRINDEMLIKDKTEIIIIYNINKKENKIKIFGSEFVKNNKYNCKMMIDNNEYEIIEEYNVNNYNNNKLEINLKGINNITDMSFMFCECKSLASLTDISKWNTNKITDMSHIFDGCSSLLSLPDISKWKTNKVTNMSFMFYECKLLSSLPDISKWNTNKITDMSHIFSGCSSLLSLSDISK